MSFLTINGVPVKIAMDGFSEKEREIGLKSFAQNGLFRKSRQAIKRDFDFALTPLLQSDAELWTNLITGEGEGWPLDSYFSYKGSGIAVANGAVIGSGKLQIPAASPAGTANFTWNTFRVGNGDCTVFVKRWINNVLDGNYIIRSDGVTYKNGIVFGGSTSWLVVNFTFTTVISAVSATITGLTGASPGNDTQYADFWVFPGVIPSAWITGGMYDSWNTLGVFTSPKLRVFDNGGSLTAIMQQPGVTAARTYLGTVDEGKSVKATLANVKSNNVRLLNVKLTEQ